MSETQPLRLIALDAEDLAIVSAHLQDAVLRIGDMSYLPREKRFATVLNRFNWFGALLEGNEARADERRRSGLRFERVVRARSHGLDLAAKDKALSLLAITFTASGADDPGGVVQLHFSGGAAIELGVECVEAELKDLGAAWRARKRPEHPDDDGIDEAGASKQKSSSGG
jgi:hypothetical protein